MELKKPLVSVITATYNRSNVLCHTIASLIKSTFEDWELIVVGDACTDDTEEVVLSFNDPRIHFINLKENFGDQGGPNNEGFRLARGRYIAYLNHDDLWLPGHLETLVRGIEESGSDMVFTTGLSLGGEKRSCLCGVMPEDRFIPGFVPASLWLLKREVLEQIGPWRHPRDCYVQPSQDLLFRIWKAGKKIRALPKVTLVSVPSGYRTGVYAGREFEENRHISECLEKDPNFLESEYLNIARSLALERIELDIWPHFRRGVKNIFKAVVLKLGFVPYELGFILRYRQKGGYINRWRKTIGLPELK